MRTHQFHVADWRRPTAEQLLPLVADLASLLEPAFASSASWPSTVTGQGSSGPPDDRFGFTTTRYASGDRAVEIDARDWPGAASVVDATCIGLREGWHLMVRAETRDDNGCALTVFFELPDVLADAVIARCPH